MAEKTEIPLLMLSHRFDEKTEKEPRARPPLPYEKTEESEEEPRARPSVTYEMTVVAEEEPRAGPSHAIQKRCDSIIRLLSGIQKLRETDGEYFQRSCIKIMSLLIEINELAEPNEEKIQNACVKCFPLLVKLMVMRVPNTNIVGQFCDNIKGCIGEFGVIRYTSDQEDTEFNGEINREENLPVVIDMLFRYASEETVLSVFKDLINMVPNIKELYTNKFNSTLLHRAVENNFVIAVELFLEYGVDQLFYDSSTNILLSIAIDNGNDEMAALLVSKLHCSDVRRLFGDSQSKTGRRLFGDSQSETGSLICQPMFKIKDLISKDLDKTLLQVLNSFIEKQNNGSYNIQLKLFDVDDIGREPSNPEFNFNNRTTFQALVHYRKEDAINHPVVRTYVDYHWNTWCQKRYLLIFCKYLFGLICLTYSAGTGATAPDVHTYDTQLQRSRAVMEVISYLYALAVLFYAIRQMIRYKKIYFDRVFNCIELFSSILMIVVLPLRYTHLKAHWYVFGVGYFLWAIRIFKYASVCSKTNFYAEVIKRILHQNFVQFGILFIVIDVIFSGTFLLMLKADDCIHTHNDTSTFQDILYVGVRTLIEAAPIVEYTGSDGYRGASTYIMPAYMFVTVVVMLSILIAQLSETYRSSMDECIKTARMNRAWIIERFQRNEWNILTRRQWIWKKQYISQTYKVDKNYFNLNDLSPSNEIMRKKQIQIGLDVRTVKEKFESFEAKVVEDMDKLKENLKRIEQLLHKRQD